MRLSHHGGMCCGIKHIFEMGQSPDEMAIALSKDHAFQDADIQYDWTTQKQSAYPEPCPKETKLERLDRYLNYLREYRPGGIVEVTLVTSGELGEHSQQKLWIPVLEERGFVEVTPDGGVYNSNSWNRVRVFHLYMEVTE